MPELAEVFRFSRSWSAGLGSEVIAVSLRERNRVFLGCEPARIREGLAGRRLSGIFSSGKQAAFVFEGEVWLGVHLGMTGRLFAETGRAEQPRWAREGAEGVAAPPDGRHDLVALDCKNGARLVFNDPRRFGRIRFHDSPGVPGWWSSLAPDILSPGFDYARFSSGLDAHPGLALKGLLLRQDLFPGVGNWMADEILWRAEIAPRVRAGRLPPGVRVRLFSEVVEVCSEAMRIIGESGEEPPLGWLFRHRWRDGGICPVTGEKLVREAVSGRTTCWSPARQRSF